MKGLIDDAIKPVAVILLSIAVIIIMYMVITGADATSFYAGVRNMITGLMDSLSMGMA